MAATQSKPSFVFVNSDVDNLNKSKLSRTLVRSQAARSARSLGHRLRKQGVVVKEREITIPEDLIGTPDAPEHNGGELARDLPSTKTLPSKQLIRRQGQLNHEQRRTQIPAQPTNPLLLFQPLLMETYSPLLITHYLTKMAVDIPELDIDTPGLLRSVWFPFALAQSGLLHIILLTAGSNYINYCDLSLQQAEGVRQCLVQLKQQALRHMREMAFSSDRSSADELIAAATKMASFEAMFGDATAFQTHMSGLRNLVDTRGGLLSLGLGGLLGRMVCWVDCNSSFLLNSPLCFPENGVLLPKPMMFDPQNFLSDTA